MTSVYEKSQSFYCRICCSFPHGKLMLLPMILLIVGFVLSNNALSSCELMYVDVDNTQFFQTTGTHKIGLFNYYSKPLGECRPFLTGKKGEGHFAMPPFDSLFKTAQAFGVLATVVGGIITIFIICVSCCVLTTERFSFKICACITFAVMIFQIFVFLMFGSNDCTTEKPGAIGGYYCGFYLQSWLVIAAWFAWLLAAASLWVMPDPDPHSLATVTTITETKLEDGRKLIITEEVHPDGTKVVTREKKDVDGSSTIKENLTKEEDSKDDEEKPVNLDLTLKVDPDQAKVEVEKIDKEEGDIEEAKEAKA